MKKLFAVALTMLSCGAIQALPLGNPAEPSFLRDGLFWDGSCADFCDPCASWCDAWSFRAGYYGDFVFNRHLEVDSGNTDGRSIEHSSLFTNAGYLVLNLWDRFDVFSTLGATNLYFSTNVVSFQNPAIAIPTPTGRFDIETETAFSWSVGGRLTVFECGCATFGIEGQYFRTNPNIRRVTLADVVSVYPSSSFDLVYDEWQVGIGVAYQIWCFVPYFGAKYSKANVSFNDELFTIILDETTDFTGTFNDLRSRFNGGYVLGVSLIDCEKIALTVEGRWPDEKAVYVNAQIRF